ncbi:uncharacterized protein LY89DRAFT_742790 [Mollisia scopiformis]|uniref:Uncharacterized protein n=1 Tax=Mollisia scopiformis TaxID=149040 RepID=A0A132B581_MOLSC|nr:uncharacterized protein LY89DRAFT_742790 [Mollisia scopiformis]KUJ07562.1 hypothetical protein LY89DRAFT_742790 [Mollisia scopiformis]
MAPIFNITNEASTEKYLAANMPLIANAIVEAVKNKTSNITASTSEMVKRVANKATHEAYCELNFCHDKPPTHPAKNVTVVFGKCADDGFNQYGCDASGKPFKHPMIRAVAPIIEDLLKRASKAANDIKCQFKLCDDNLHPSKYIGMHSTDVFGNCPQDGEFYQFGCDASGKPYKHEHLAGRSLQTVLADEALATQHHSDDGKSNITQMLFILLVAVVAFIAMFMLYGKVKKILGERKERKAGRDLAQMEDGIPEMAVIVVEEEEYSDFV